MAEWVDEWVGEWMGGHVSTPHTYHLVTADIWTRSHEETLYVISARPLLCVKPADINPSICAVERYNTDSWNRDTFIHRL